MSLQAAEVVKSVSPPLTEVPQESSQEPQKEEALSPKLAIIARKERDLVQRQQAWLKEKQEMEARLKDAMDKRSASEELEKLWKEDPLKALERFGHSYESLTQRMLQGADIAPSDVLKKVDERFKSWEQQQADREAAQKKAEEESRKKAEEEVITNFKGELKTFIDKGKDKYKLTNLLDKDAELLFETIEAYFEQHGKVLTQEEAADMLEKYYVSLLEQANALMKPKDPEAEAAEAEKKELGAQAPKKVTTPTLTNSMASFMPSNAAPKTEQERMQRALAALERQKK